MDIEQTQQGSKRQIKDSKESYKMIDFFPNDERQSLLIKKTEKLTTAIYLITDFLNEKESLKWEVRSRAVSLLSFMMSSFNTSMDRHLDGDVFTKQAQKLIGDILSFLELAFRINLVSIMNFSILKEEYTSLYGYLYAWSKKNGPSHNVVFPDNFFKEELSFDTLSETALRDKGQHSKGHFREKRQNTSKVSFMSHRLSFTNKDKTERRESILQLIRTKGEVNIKDITPIVTGCSGKTIQRELSSLIAQGVLERRGERRWSSYALKPKQQINPVSNTGITGSQEN